MKDKKKYGNWISGLLLLVLMGVTFYLLLREYSFAEIAGALKRANLGYIGLGITAMFIFIASEAAIIYSAMKTLNKKIRFRRCMEYSFIGFYFSSITPSSTGGQPAQIYYMKKDKISVSHSSLILLIITSVYQMTMLVYGIIMYLLRHRELAGGMSFLKWLFLFGVIVNGASAVFLLFAVFYKKLAERILYFCIGVLTKIKIIRSREAAERKLDKSLEEYEKGAGYIKERPAFLLKTILFTMIQITAMYMVPYFVYCALPLKGNSLLDILAVQAVLSLSVSCIPLPGAVGASESGFMILYRMLFTGALLFPAMLLSRIISFYLILLVSGGVSLYVGIRQRRSCKAYGAS